MSLSFLNVLAVMAFATSGFVVDKDSKVENKESSIKKEKELVFKGACCTKVVMNPNTGEMTAATACAGWFLSNTERAQQRACDKAEKALEQIGEEGVIIN